MRLAANPYHHIDHRGRLAGACDEPEPLRPSGPQVSHRRLIGAERKETEGSFVKEDKRTGVQAHSDLFFAFSAEPVDVHAPHGPILFHYMDLIKNAEVLVAEKDGSMPMDALAEQRIAAIERVKAETGDIPDTSQWEAQFPLDPKVAEHASKMVVRVAAERAAKAEKTKKDAEAKAQKIADAQKIRDDKREAHLKAERESAEKYAKALAHDAPPPTALPPGDAPPKVEDPKGKA